ncbi:MAG TPA: hypothetical protein VGE10_06915 [Zeimonas sp.]
MKTLLAALLLAASPFVLAGETVGLWVCPGDVYTDRPCAGGTRLAVDPSVNLVAAETRRPRPAAEASQPSVLLIPRAKPATYEPRPSTYSPLISGTPIVGIVP